MMILVPMVFSRIRSQSSLRDMTDGLVQFSYLDDWGSVATVKAMDLRGISGIPPYSEIHRLS